MNMSWLNNEQWSSGQGFNQQQQGHSNWQGQPPIGGRSEGEWQAMQQAPPTSQGALQGQMFPGQGQFVNMATPQGYAAGGGYGGGQGSGGVSGQPAGPYGYPQQHVPHQQTQQWHQQELERRMKEEQKQRELEIQRRKMQNMNIAKPTSGDMESLIALPVSTKTNTPSPTRGRKQEVSPPVGRPAVMETERSGSRGAAAASNSAPLPEGTVKESNIKSNDMVDVERDSLEKLMESTLTNLTQNPSRASFKFNPLSTPTSRGLSAVKIYSPSTKARSWTADTAYLKGMFSQHSRQEDEFGEFHSVSIAGKPQVSSGQGTHVSGQGPHVSGQGVRMSGQTPQLHGQSTPGGQERFPHLTPHVGSGSTNAPMSTQQQPVADAHPHPTMTSQQATPPVKFAGLDTSKFPTLYTEVYRRCVQGGGSLSTELLFPILLSSKLPSHVLRDLWTQANREVPGQLNQMELFVLLGLIGLVQSGNAKPTMNDLKQAPQLPIPLLSVVQVPQTHPSSNSPKQSPHIHRADNFGEFQRGQSACHAPQKPQKPANIEPPATASGTDITSMASFNPPPSDRNSVVSSMSSLEFKTAATFTSSVSSSGSFNSFSSQDVQPSTSPASESDKYSAFTSSNTQPVISSALMSEKYGSAKLQDVQFSTSSSDNYSAFTSVSSTLLSSGVFTSANQTSSVSSCGDKYSAFTSANQTSSVNSGGDKCSVLASKKPASSTEFQTSSLAGIEHEEDEFSSFSSAPPIPAAQVSTLPRTLPSLSAPPTSFLPPLVLQSTVPPPLSDDDQGWADFAQASYVSQSIPVVSAGPPTTVAATSAFDDILPKELALATRKAQPTTSEAKSTPEVTPKTTPKLVTKMSGLDILDDEMSRRIASSAVPSHAQSLVPETLSHVSSSSSLDNMAKWGWDEVMGDSGSVTSLTGRAKVNPEPCKVWLVCLDKCREVLATCAAVFASVQEEKAVLEEIVQSEEGRNRLKCIAEIYRLSRRVYYSIKEKKCGDECKEVVDGIVKEWDALTCTLPGGVMDQLYKETHPTDMEEGVVEGDFLSDTISRCSLCLIGKTVSIPAVFSLTGNPENYLLPLLFHEGQMYHSTCANFWINIVQERLPELNE